MPCTAQTLGPSPASSRAGRVLCKRARSCSGGSLTTCGGTLDRGGRAVVSCTAQPLPACNPQPADARARNPRYWRLYYARSHGGQAVDSAVWATVLEHRHEAAALRAPALRSPAAQSPNGAAELAWLDGLIAHAQADAAGLRDAGAELRRNTARSAPTLIESLEALTVGLAGDHEGAARRLATLEWEGADEGWHQRFGPAHPYVNSVNRLAAGRWLLEAGDTTEAGRVLLWHRAVLPSALHPLPAVNTTLGNLALFELAQIEEARSRPELARLYNMLFLERYDRPPPQHREMVERARASTARLAARE